MNPRKHPPASPPRSRLGKGLAALAIGCALTSGQGCARSSEGSNPPVQVTIDMKELRPIAERAASKRVLFTHMSVGANLIEGLNGLLAETGTGWRVLQAESAAPGPGLLHALPGENGNARSKIDAFAALVRSTQPRPDLALMKLCYVDVAEGIDTEAVFTHYVATLRALEKEFPEVVFAHVTVPLSTHPMSAKARVKRLLGRTIWEDASNVIRADYNERLKQTFAGSPIFDLAAIESTRPDGSREEHRIGDRLAPSLVPAYASDDSGHLAPPGQRLAARGLLELVALLPEKAAE